MAPSESVRFTFTVDTMPSDAFRVLRLEGEEAVSSLFRFDVEILSPRTDIDPGELVSSIAHLGLSTFGQQRTLHGIVAGAALVRPVPGVGTVCRIRLVPRLWRMTQNRQYQIYAATEEKSVVDILEAELTGDGLSGPGAAAPCDLGDDDYELRLDETYPTREHIVQYDESDFSFVSRHLEERGIFYFFDHAGGKDVVVFGDHNAAFPDVEAKFEIAYRSDMGLVHGDPSIDRFEVATAALPKKVVLTDYNYRLPHVTQLGEAIVDPDGHGVVVDLGDLFRTPEEGADLARVRADALLCRKVTCSGGSDCVLFGAGKRFTLRDHPTSAIDRRRYILESVRHEGWQPTGLGDGAVDAALPEQAGYRNSFVALKAEPAYRPEKRTPAPMMAGLMHGHIDGEGTGERAELDDQGRYRVRVPFDLSGNADGEASGYVRMAQPYGGSGSGMHFPLTKGTEVVLGAIHGNPDRPVILAAVPNPSTPSPVTNSSQNTNRLKTNSGMLFEMNDGSGTTSTTTSGGGFGSGAGGSAGAGGSGRLAPQRQLEAGNGAGLAAQRQESSTYESESTTGGDLWTKIDVPAYDGGDSETYLRLGAADSDTETVSGFTDSVSGLDGFDGWLDYTDGNRATVTRSSKSELVSDALTLQVGGDAAESIGGGRGAWIGGSDTLSVASAQDVTIGGDRTESIAGSHGLTVDGSQSISTGARGETIHGDYDGTVNGDYTLSLSGSNSVSIGNDNNVEFNGDDFTFTYGDSLEVSCAANMSISIGLELNVALAITMDINLTAAFEFNAFQFGYTLVSIENEAAAKISDTGAAIRTLGADISSVGASIETGFVALKTNTMNIFSS